MRWSPVINAERFWAKVEKTDGCWLWRGSRNGRGYGTYCNQPAHRIAYELEHGPALRVLEIDHLCMVRHCVNPRHLEAVSKSENGRRIARRSWGKSGHRLQLEIVLSDEAALNLHLQAFRAKMTPHKYMREALMKVAATCPDFK
jgi:hypothetical protein